MTERSNSAAVFDQATAHKSGFLCWHEWFDSSKSVSCESTIEEVVRLPASIVVSSDLRFIFKLLRFTTISLFF